MSDGRCPAPKLNRRGISILLSTTLTVTAGVPFVAGYRLGTNLAEILMYTSSLTSQEMADTMAWLMSRWGI